MARRSFKKGFSVLTLVAMGCTTPESHSEKVVFEKPGLACHISQNESYILYAPRDWILDGKSGLNQNFCIVGYPEGADWENSTAVFYTNRLSKISSALKSLPEIIRADVAQFKKDYPRIQVNDEPALRTKDGRLASVRHFLLAAPPLFEAVAYIDHPEYVLVLVLTSKTQDDFEASLDVFHELVSSYRSFNRPVEFVHQK